jgi:hypothetical protein
VILSLSVLTSVYSYTVSHVSAATSRECGSKSKIPIGGRGDYIILCCDVERDDQGSITGAKCLEIVCDKGQNCVFTSTATLTINPENLSKLVEKNSKALILMF